MAGYGGEAAAGPAPRGKQRAGCPGAFVRAATIGAGAPEAGSGVGSAGSAAGVGRARPGGVLEEFAFLSLDKQGVVPRGTAQAVRPQP